MAKDTCACVGVNPVSTSAPEDTKSLKITIPSTPTSATSASSTQTPFKQSTPSTPFSSPHVSRTPKRLFSPSASPHSHSTPSPQPLSSPYTPPLSKRLKYDKQSGSSALLVPDECLYRTKAGAVWVDEAVIKSKYIPAELACGLLSMCYDVQNGHIVVLLNDTTVTVSLPKWMRVVPVASVSKEPDFGSFTSVGGKKHNEDRFFCHRIYKMGTTQSFRMYTCLAVMDGHGGSHAADFCETWLVPCLCSFDNINLEKAILQLEAEYCACFPQSNAGTTVCTILVCHNTNEYWCCNVGDSRALLLKANDKNTGHDVSLCQALSKDHRFTPSVHAGKLFPLPMDRVIGDPLLKIEFPLVLSGQPETLHGCLDIKQVNWFALGTDGTFDKLSNDEFCTLVTLYRQRHRFRFLKTAFNILSEYQKYDVVQHENQFYCCVNEKKTNYSSIINSMWWYRIVGESATAPRSPTHASANDLDELCRYVTRHILQICKSRGNVTLVLFPYTCDGCSFAYNVNQ
jgi:serine/threonine protein phosphatase PrpC